MTAADDLRDMLIRLGGPLQHTDTKESWLRRVARLAGMSERQARQYYYREAKRVDADTYLRIQQQIVDLERTIANRKETLNALETLLRTRTPPVGSFSGRSRALRDEGGVACSTPGGAGADKSKQGQ